LLDIPLVPRYIAAETKVSSPSNSGNLFTVMPTHLVDLFLDAVKVDALSLKERPMAQFVKNALCGLPLEIREDLTAQMFNGECGNLICIPSGFDPSRPSIALLAHMDTPRETVHVRPVVSDSQIASDGTTALGVDNRAGTSVLLHVLRQHLEAGNPGNFVVVFTVGEELGLFGSKYVDLSPYNVKMCFIFDCSKRPGTFIQAAVGCSLYDATFVGTSSHAAVAPEKGVNAIQIASRAIAQIPMGRLSPTMTSNVGMIAGGTATNVVPDRCTIQGEVREFDPHMINDHMTMLERVFRSTAKGLGGDVEFQTREDFAPFRLSAEHPVFVMTVDALKSVGLKPHPIDYLGGSDANMLNAKGIPSVNLGIGAQNPHGNDEFILVEDLDKSAEIAVELIARSGSLL
jgi:tripeptide aminopeptidase